jgi:hypothetical protein
MQGFDYPNVAHSRRHGPRGYDSDESYRDWLRDEFMFRCVYCLHREKWYGRPTTFHIEHAIPRASDESLVNDYDNLLYSCATCNNAKRAVLDVPNPCEIAFAECLRVEDDGSVTPLNDHGIKLEDTFRFNRPSNREQRRLWIDTLAALRSSAIPLFREYMAFPNELPDLRAPRKRVPENSRPNGVNNCYFVLRERGELPTIY